MSSNSATSKIASGELLVKSKCPGAGKRPLGLTQSGFQHSHRPDVLSKMPRSCNLLFDLLRSMADQRGQARVSLGHLADVSHLGSATVWRALRRLEGARLVVTVTPGSGKQATTWRVLWRSPLCRFPQASVPPAPIRSKPRDSRVFNPKGTAARPRGQPGERALRWAAAQVRRELAGGFTSDPTKGRAIVTGVQAALWRAVEGGRVRPGPHLGRVLRSVLRCLHDAHERAPAVGPWSAWASWAVKLAIEEDRQDRLERLATDRLVAQIRREKDEARGGLEALLANSGCGRLKEWLKREGSTCVDDDMPDGPETSMEGNRRDKCNIRHLRTRPGCPRPQGVTILQDTHGTVQLLTSNRAAPMLISTRRRRRGLRGGPRVATSFFANEGGEAGDR